MSSRDLKELSCDYCGNHDTFDILAKAEEVLPIIGKWKGVIDGDAPPGQSDNHRWYDCLECLVAGEKQYADRKEEEARKSQELEEKLARANEALKRSGFIDKPGQLGMDKAAQLAKA